MPTINPTSQNRPVFSILMDYAPYRDFFDLVQNYANKLTGKLVRTCFRQVIDSLEYIHSQGVAHLDIKLENILLGRDFQLKLADFDVSYKQGNERVTTAGSFSYRAPELRARKCKNKAAADIYSAAMLVFAIKCIGVVAHTEEELVDGINLEQLLKTKPEEFFKIHCAIQNRDSSFFDEDLKKLFVSMTKENPERRAIIREIKYSKWYKGTVYTNEELKIFGNFILEL